MALLSLQSEGQGQCFVPPCFLPLLVCEQTLKHPHPLKIYEQSPNFPPPAKKEKQQQQPKKKNLPENPQKTKENPKTKPCCGKQADSSRSEEPSFKKPKF